MEIGRAFTNICDEGKTSTVKINSRKVKKKTHEIQIAIGP